MSTALGWEHPPPGGYTTEDLDEMPGDGFHRELIDGVLHVSPSPESSHQTIAMLLGARLHAIRPPGYAVTQGVDVRINSRRCLIPDVQVVDAQALREGSRKRFSASEVILAVEIVSPTSQAMDRFAKPAMYAAAGIENYWRIETESGVEVCTYRLDAVTETYRLTGEFDKIIDIADPWPIVIPIAEITP